MQVERTEFVLKVGHYLPLGPSVLQAWRLLAQPGVLLVALCDSQCAEPELVKLRESEWLQQARVLPKTEQQ